MQHNLVTAISEGSGQQQVQFFGTFQFHETAELASRKEMEVQELKGKSVQIIIF